MYVPFVSAIAKRRSFQSQALASSTLIKIALLSEDIMFQLEVRRMIEDLPQNCILESYLKYEQALPFLDLAPPFLLLIDVRAANYCKNHWMRNLQICRPHLPTIMISGRSAPENLDRSFRSFGYLVTLVTMPQLESCLRARESTLALCQLAQACV